MGSTEQIAYPFALTKPSGPDEILDRMERIVRRERLIHGQYAVRGTWPDPDAICGGHRFCAIGTLLFAAGEPIEERVGSFRDLWIEAVTHAGRDRVDAPGYREVRQALNEVALERIGSEKFRRDDNPSCGVSRIDSETDPNPDALEDFFENFERVLPDGTAQIDHTDLLGVIHDARDLIHSSTPSL